MASKRRVRENTRKKQCEGKTRYPKLAAQIRASKKSKKDLKFNAYRCCFCGFWHIGHMPQRILTKIFMKGT